MLTGDENIVDIDFDVVWQVNPARAQDYVFNLQNPQGTIKSVAESAMREVIGRRKIQAILTTEQASVAQEVRQIMQQTLDAYDAGVLVNVVQLQAAQPPAEVRQAFFDVNAAQQDAVRVQNEAETFASRVVPGGPRRGGAGGPAGRRPTGSSRSPTPPVRRPASAKVYDEYRKAPDSHPRAHLPRDDGARASAAWTRSSSTRTAGPGRRALSCPSARCRDARQGAPAQPSREPPDEQRRLRTGA